MDFKEIYTFLIEFATTYGAKLIGAIIILIVGMKLIGWLTKWLRTSEKLSKLDSSLRSFLVSFCKIVLYIVLIVTVAMILGVPATSFITILASCGVAVGLALQGSLSNFAGGLMILFFKPFKVGDYIETSGEAGIVEEISVVYTELLTLDNRRITMPNGALTNSVIKNYSSENLRRVDLTFNADYKCDVQKVKDIILSIANSHPKALKDPEPFVRLSDHSEYSLTYTVRIWCKNADYWDLYFDVIESVKAEFDKNNINIPYPQMDIYVSNK